MNDTGIFEIDERFDPLKDQRLDDDEIDQETDYLPPIPDAEHSHITKAAPLTARERIENLLAGIPGQRFRILHAVGFCTEPRCHDELVAEIDAAYPDEVSVYDAAQIVQLLKRAGALAETKAPVPGDEGSEDGSEGGSDGEGAEGVRGEGEGTAPQEGPSLTVPPAPTCTYLATAAGLDAYESNVGKDAVHAVFAGEERYLPLYRTILELTAEEGGCSTRALDAVIDPDPLCETPRRFCGYFLGRLEGAGAVRWLDNWVITEQGRSVLASDIFKDCETAD
jgi:hypothetical protein